MSTNTWKIRVLNIPELWMLWILGEFWVVKLRYFDKHFIKNTRKRDPTGKHFEVLSSGATGKHFEVFSFIYSWNYILNGKLKDGHSQDLSFQNQEILFDFQKRQGRSPFFPGYALIFLHMPKYPWKSLNKLFRLC